MKTITIQYGPANAIIKQVGDNTTVRDVLENRSYQATLGYGTNVQALDSERRRLDLNARVTDGGTVVLETVANQKAAPNMVDITIQYGPANAIQKSVPHGTKVADVLNNPAYQAALGYGTNVQALDDDRNPMSPDTTLEDGDVMNLETVANQKAA